MFKHMAVKTITIKEDAYNVLSSMKRPDESFSELILRIGSEKPVTAKDLFGKSRLPKKELEALRKNAREARERFNKGMRGRRNVLARHFRNN